MKERRSGKHYNYKSTTLETLFHLRAEIGSVRMFRTTEVGSSVPTIVQGHRLTLDQRDVPTRPIDTTVFPYLTYLGSEV